MLISKSICYLRILSNLIVKIETLSSFASWVFCEFFDFFFSFTRLIFQLVCSVEEIGNWSVAEEEEEGRNKFS